MLSYRTFVAAGLAFAVGACGTASSETPNSSKPAHCIAAFNYGRQLALAGPSPKLSLAVQSTARALFVGKRLEANGTFATGEKEGAVLLKDHGHDPDIMMPLLLECSKRQDADPAYQAMNDNGQLMAAARKTDPACRSDAACLNTTK